MGEHLPARSEKEQVQGVQRGQHLPAQSDNEQVQDVHSRQGRLDAAWSRRALALTYTSFTLARSLVCTFCVSFVATRSRICQTTLLPFVSFPPHRYTHAITNTNTHTHTRILMSSAAMRFRAASKKGATNLRKLSHPLCFLAPQPATLQHKMLHQCKLREGERKVFMEEETDHMLVTHHSLM